MRSNVQYSIQWIININEKNTNVQIGCTGYVHIAAVWIMENNGCVYSLIN